MNCFKPCTFHSTCRNCDLGLSENRDILYKFMIYKRSKNLKKIKIDLILKKKLTLKTYFIRKPMNPF